MKQDTLPLGHFFPLSLLLIGEEVVTLRKKIEI